MHAIDKSRATASKTPLVVLIGEHHCMPSHIALKTLLAKRLLKKGENFTFDFEYPHNYWSTFAVKNMGLRIPTGLVNNVRDFDQDGSATLSMFMGSSFTEAATQANFNLIAFCYKNKIRTAFCDAVRDPLVPALPDETTAEAARQYFDDLGQPQPKDFNVNQKPHDMPIRNRVIRNLALRHATKHQASLVVLSVGNAHIAGNAAKNRGYGDSLHALFNKAGVPVLPVFLTDAQEFNIHNISAEARARLTNAVVVGGLAENTFDDRFQVNPEEWRVLTRMAEKSGWELPLNNVIAARKDYASLARKDAEGVLQKYAAVNKTPENYVERSPG